MLTSVKPGAASGRAETISYNREARLAPDHVLSLRKLRATQKFGQSRRQGLGSKPNDTD